MFKPSTPQMLYRIKLNSETVSEQFETKGATGTSYVFFVNGLVYDYSELRNADNEIFRTSLAVTNFVRAEITDEAAQQKQLEELLDYGYEKMEGIEAKMPEIEKLINAFISSLGA